MNSLAQNLANKLFDIKAVRFGDFKLKSGINSPIYIDLRLIISEPKLLREIGGLFYEKIKKLQFDLICGVPYTALPIACAISLEQNIPMLIRRKEAKEYGTKKIIEGVFKNRDNCLIIEDLITSGMSILETKKSLENEGLVVENAIVLIDRQQGGINNLSNQLINLYSVFKLNEILKALVNSKKISVSQENEVIEFTTQNQISFS